MMRSSSTTLCCAPFSSTIANTAAPALLPLPSADVAELAASSERVERFSASCCCSCWKRVK